MIELPLWAFLTAVIAPPAVSLVIGWSNNRQSLHLQRAEHEAVADRERRAALREFRLEPARKLRDSLARAAAAMRHIVDRVYQVEVLRKTGDRDFNDARDNRIHEVVTEWESAVLEVRTHLQSIGDERILDLVDEPLGGLMARFGDMLGGVGTGPPYENLSPVSDLMDVIIEIYKAILELQRRIQSVIAGQL